MTEPREITIRRLKMRSMRRGIKEMDLILPAFAAAHLEAMADLTLYDALLSENDHDLYQWIIGLSQAPDRYAVLIDAIAQSVHGVSRPA